MKVCVTGGAGYIGSHLVAELVKLGHEVVVVDNMSNGFTAITHPMVKVLSCDIREISQVEKELQGTVVFFHLAANKQATSDNAYDMFSINVGGTMSVLETAKRIGAKRFVFSSSAAVYPAMASECNPDGKIRERDAGGRANPENIYGLSKLMGERLCHLMADDGFSVACLRYFNVWGGYYQKENRVKSAIEIFRECKRNNQPVKIYGDGSSVRDYVSVYDVVDANLRVMSYDLWAPSVWNICTGRPTKVLDVVHRECGECYPIEFLPKRPNEVDYSVGCFDLAKDFLKWYPERLYT